MQCLPTGAEASKRGVARLCHVDAYRLKDERELAAIGFDEFADSRDTVTVVEWADRMPSLHLKKGYRELTIEFGEGNDRFILED
jgi:tRNA threonylcarbamoyladenosine biosynthesis protein TsaE